MSAFWILPAWEPIYLPIDGRYMSEISTGTEIVFKNGEQDVNKYLRLKLGKVSIFQKSWIGNGNTLGQKFFLYPLIKIRIWISFILNRFSFQSKITFVLYFKSYCSSSQNFNAPDQGCKSQDFSWAGRRFSTLLQIKCNNWQSIIGQHSYLISFYLQFC